MRLIDADKAISDYAHDGISHPYDAYDLEDILNECPIIEAIPKADYEARLKADMVAMLTEIQLEIEEQCKIPNNCARAYDWNNGVYACYKAVQEKIDKLKGEQDG